MKIFAVYSTLNFKRKPDWLDGFRIKYGYLYPYHVTLKQPTYIKEDELVNVKKILSDFFNKLNLPQHKIDIVFDKLIMGSPIMIEATGKEEISKLQDKVVAILSDYSNFVRTESKNWEEDFKPHITITPDLDEENLKRAKLDLGEDVRCEATIEEVVLVIAQDMTSSEESKEKIIYKI